MIKCIIFDCDGTLVDSEYLCNLGLELKLREIQIEESAHEMVIKYRGGKLSEILKSLELKYNIVLDEDFVTSYRALVETLFENNLKPIDGVINTLEKLNLPKCVASSGPLKKIEKSLSLTNLKQFFNDNIFSSYEINSWKPEPELFLHAAEKMGFRPNQCAVVEDSQIGIHAAIAANMLPIFYDPLNLNIKDSRVRIIKKMRELHSVIT
ncbi:MAG: HAD-IA family hydrolase [Thiohalomonadales bacterium]